MDKTFFSERAHASALDRSDPLAGFRQRFFIPADTIYVDGNSLGLLSDDAEKSVLRVLDEWRNLGIRGWLDARWFYFAEEMGELAAPIVGAAPGELVMGGSTTVNIHALLSTFYKPEERRTQILADALNFPSDIYALKGQIKLRGLNPEQELVLTTGGDGRNLDEADIVRLMNERVALVFLPSVLYSSGQLLDMESLCREARRRDILIGFDCSHSAGAVPHHFSKWGVDFATFCSYKYMNGGPGCGAFIYVNQKHFHREPLMAGWFGYAKDRQFDMSLDFQHQQSAGGWQISTPGILGSATMEGSLALIREAGIEAIREKSLRLTGYFADLVRARLTEAPYHYGIATPMQPQQRGGHIALTHPTEALRICEALKARGIVPDFRQPDIIRIAPVALYNTFTEVWTVAQALKEIIDHREYEKFPRHRKAVS